MKPKPGDISIVENVGTFLMWYDMRQLAGLTGRRFGRQTAKLYCERTTNVPRLCGARLDFPAAVSLDDSPA